MDIEKITLQAIAGKSPAGLSPQGRRYYDSVVQDVKNAEKIAAKKGLGEPIFELNCD